MAALDPTSRSEQGSREIVWAVFFLIGLLGAIFSGAAWEPYTGILLSLGGLMMLLFPPEVASSRLWWLLALVFVMGSLTAFLPASVMGGFPAWRQHLESLGVATGTSITIQKPQAIEMLWVFISTLVVGLWLVGHRASPLQIRRWALAFSAGVAVYAILSELTRDWQFIARPGGHFGFFPNRNHTGTYLAMGITCGLGVLLQSVREKRTASILISAVSIGVALWAAVGWSISRGGVLLTGIGSVLWLVTVGPRYLGSQGRRAVALLLVTIVGGYLLADTQVKTRLAKTTDAAAEMLAQNEKDGAAPVEQAAESLDFRVPIALDTFDLLRDQNGFGIGAGQFSYVIPQYRKRTIVANDSKLLHPESDWLWMAAEAGIPATLALLLLVVLASIKSFREIMKGRDRSIRLACLIAALLVAIHGFLDVPGHRIALAWTAAFLFSLSLRTSDDWSRPSPSPWLSRVLGVAILAGGTWLIGGYWFHWPESATGLAERRNQAAMACFDAAVDKRGGLVRGGVTKLQEAVRISDETAKLLPLDYRAYGLSGRILLFFPDQFQRARTDFAAEQALQPSWVKIPYLQGLQWSSVDPALSVESWKEMLRRADAVDSQNPQAKLRSRLLATLERISKKNPVLQAALSQAQAQH